MRASTHLHSCCYTFMTLPTPACRFQPVGHFVVGEMSVYRSLTFLFPACLKHGHDVFPPVFSWDNIFPFKHQFGSCPAAYHKVWAGCPKVFCVIVFSFPMRTKTLHTALPVAFKLFTWSVGEVIVIIGMCCLSTEHTGLCCASVDSLEQPVARLPLWKWSCPVLGGTIKVLH